MIDGTTSAQQKQLAALMNSLFMANGSINKATQNKLSVFFKDNHLALLNLNATIEQGPQQGNSFFFVISAYLPSLLPKILKEQKTEVLAHMDYNSVAVSGIHRGKSSLHMISLALAVGNVHAQEALHILLEQLPFNQPEYTGVFDFGAVIQEGEHQGCSPFWFITLAAINGRPKALEIITEKPVSITPFLNLRLLLQAKPWGFHPTQSQSCADMLKHSLWQDKIRFLVTLEDAQTLYIQYKNSNFSDLQLKNDLAKSLQLAENAAHIAQDKAQGASLDVKSLHFFNVFCRLAEFYYAIGDFENMDRVVNTIAEKSPLFEDFHQKAAMAQYTYGQQYADVYQPVDPLDAQARNKRYQEILVLAWGHTLKAGKKGVTLAKALGFSYTYPNESGVPAVTTDGITVGKSYNPLLDHIVGKEKGCISGSPTTSRYILNTMANSVHLEQENAALKAEIARLRQGSANAQGNASADDADPKSRTLPTI